MEMLLKFRVNLVMMDKGYTWKEWSQHIIQSIERLNNSIIETDTEVSHIHDDIIELKLKCKILWGLIGGLLGTLATLITLVITGVVVR